MKDYTKYILKKRLYGYLGVALVLTLLLALALPARNAGRGQDSTGTTTSTSGTTLPAAGTVTVYTCDQSLYSTLCTLAEAYTGQTGIRVTVLTGNHGDLDTLMAADQAPTLFCLHSLADMQKWQSSLYDLTGTALLEQLCAQEFALELEGKKLAVTMDFHSSGLIYNATLLAQTGFTRSDIQNFADLEVVCNYITAGSSGFAAFSPVDLTDTDHESAVCMLAGMLRSPDALRSFWDLYLAHAAKAGKSLEQFLQSDAVFYVGSSRDYDTVSELGANQLDFLPAYASGQSGLQCISTLAWGINSQAEEQDIQQTLAFWQWLVTAAQGSPAPIDSLGLLAPFRDAANYGNPLEKKLRSYIASDAVRVDWDSCEAMTDTQLGALAEALAAYSEAPTDENWQAVAAACEISI